MSSIFAGVGLMEFEESTVAASLFDGSLIIVHHDLCYIF